MLTIKQPVHYGYRSIHDLPTPPSTSRPSPPLTHQDSSYRAIPAVPRSHSPPDRLMSGSHRGLPPPSAMGLGQPLPSGVASHPPPTHGSSLGQGPPPPPPPPSQSQQQGLGQPLGQLPPPPPGWQGSEDSMRAWLHAKAEEDKRKQEEERTSQERLRLEQRRTEYDILRASLQGGVPPPLVPVVFAGMGGGNLPPAALEWAQQFMYSQSQGGPPQHLLPGPASPEYRRDSQAQVYGHYSGSGGVPSTPGSAQGAHGSFVGTHPNSSPRARGYSMPSSGSRPLGGGPGLSSLNTSVLPSTGGASAAQTHPGVASAQQQQQQQQEPQQSPSIYFHMWQPPTSQGGQSGSNQPATPSVGESPQERRIDIQSTRPRRDHWIDTWDVADGRLGPWYSKRQRCWIGRAIFTFAAASDADAYRNAFSFVPTFFR
ncbi:hypothetical protein J7T55_006492 [Diaporthe amygdali]|uniref:uncharacterized protein n=1 Tax=Phomopsis amygdali TaxID=1214568 RepID=UPI0022FDB7D7|nr:uncharacterized protein J7T55_006492 [Diaporthe amygdali]KAJ0125148.1 hypothetical protein J7T55_006492 [Diaporthe amygdali]